MVLRKNHPPGSAVKHCRFLDKGAGVGYQGQASFIVLDGLSMGCAGG